MVEVYEIDIKENYYVDEDLNVFKTLDDFYEYHEDEYEGIKDDLETWQENLADNCGVIETSGDDAILMIVTDLENRLDYWRNKYEEEK